MKRKAQINLEFIASAALYLLALGTVVTASSSMLPSYSQSIDRRSLNLEAKTVTDQMLTEPGKHDYGTGGTQWEQNSSTITNTTSLGLATDFLKLERDKIEALSTTGADSFNYSQFKQVTGAENQYRFRFSFMPLIQTNKSFRRGKPPTVDGEQIIEPDVNIYSSADNEIHYGSTYLEGRRYTFLVTAHSGIYNTTYFSKSWDFENSVPRGEKETLSSYGEEYVIQSFQNRPEDKGSLLILKRELKTFGAGIDSDSIVTKLDRFAVIEDGEEDEAVKIEVWTW